MFELAPAYDKTQLARLLDSSGVLSSDWISGLEKELDKQPRNYNALKPALNEAFEIYLHSPYKRLTPDEVQKNLYLALNVVDVLKEFKGLKLEQLNGKVAFVDILKERLTRAYVILSSMSKNQIEKPPRGYNASQDISFIIKASQILEEKGIKHPVRKKIDEVERYFVVICSGNEDGTINPVTQEVIERFAEDSKLQKQVGVKISSFLTKALKGP